MPKARWRGISPCYQSRWRIKPLGTNTMGQQTKTVVKRRRRKLYLKRKKEQVKLGGIVKKSSVAKKATEAAPAAKKAAKKAPAAKKAAKKAPAKKVAKSEDAVAPEVVDAAEAVQTTEASESEA